MNDVSLSEKAWQSLSGTDIDQGCARISRAAAREIAGILGLTSAPCAYQGRIGGAKGIWFVDALDEVWTQSSRNFWIEITDSQFKFEKHQIDILYPDPARVTFEVHSYSKPLSSASLNFQLMPILAHQGVPQREFQRLLEEDITSKIEELSNATDSILSLRKWNDNNAGSEAVRVEGIQMHGGLPCLRHDKINWLIDVRKIIQAVHGHCLHKDSTDSNPEVASCSRNFCSKQSVSTA